MADIFISYSKPDHALAVKLAAFLESEGWSVWWDKSLGAAETATVATILSGGLKEFSYVYDFGDSWQHRIIVEDVKPAAANALSGVSWR
jgi:hypothetical protein